MWSASSLPSSVMIVPEWDARHWPEATRHLQLIWYEKVAWLLTTRTPFRVARRSPSASVQCLQSWRYLAGEHAVMADAVTRRAVVGFVGVVVDVAFGSARVVRVAEVPASVCPSVAAS